MQFFQVSLQTLKVIDLIKLVSEYVLFKRLQNQSNKKFMPKLLAKLENYCRKLETGQSKKIDFCCKLLLSLNFYVRTQVNFTRVN